jgi:hypothetical protein
MVICGDVEYAAEQKDTVLNPAVIVEVLSPSTQDYDRGPKFDHHRTLPSLIDSHKIDRTSSSITPGNRQTVGFW